MVALREMHHINIDKAARIWYHFRRTSRRRATGSPPRKGVILWDIYYCWLFWLTFLCSSSRQLSLFWRINHRKTAARSRKCAAVFLISLSNRGACSSHDVLFYCHYIAFPENWQEILFLIPSHLQKSSPSFAWHSRSPRVTAFLRLPFVCTRRHLHC